MRSHAAFGLVTAHLGEMAATQLQFFDYITLWQQPSMDSGFGNLPSCRPKGYNLCFARYCSSFTCSGFSSKAARLNIYLGPYF